MRHTVHPTPGWTVRPGPPWRTTVKNWQGEWEVETLYCEWKKSDDGGPITYWYEYAVTFVSEDGRRVEFGSLGGMTYGEVISTALWAEKVGRATVTYPNGRRPLKVPPRLRRQ